MPPRKQCILMKEMEIEGLGSVAPGLKVHHAVFGVGEIKALAAWADGSKTVQVDFGTHGAKWLVPQYAKLSRVKPP